MMTSYPDFLPNILMHLQMPIVDGLTSTKMIRSSEKTTPSNNLSSRASRNSRVPIFAVSASLLEKERKKYIEAGFDGWFLKPIDFKRVAFLFEGIVDDSARDHALYTPGHWEQGGWFLKRDVDVFTNTVPSQKVPFTTDKPQEEVGNDPPKRPDEPHTYLQDQKENQKAEEQPTRTKS